MLLTMLFLMQSGLPPQVERGQALFLDESNACASCHALKGKGTAVGPDLKIISSMAPRAIVTMVKSTLTQYVINVKPKNGAAFPAMPGAKDDKTIQLYDLSKMPPEARKMDLADIESMHNNESWKHPPLTRQYSPEQMADIIAYIKWAGSGDKKKVDPDDVK